MCNTNRFRIPTKAIGFVHLAAFSIYYRVCDTICVVFLRRSWVLFTWLHFSIYWKIMFFPRRAPQVSCLRKKKYPPLPYRRMFMCSHHELDVTLPPVPQGCDGVFIAGDPEKKKIAVSWPCVDGWCCTLVKEKKKKHREKKAEENRKNNATKNNATKNYQTTAGRG